MTRKEARLSTGSTATGAFCRTVRESWPVRAMSGLPLEAAEKRTANIDALGQ